MESGMPKHRFLLLDGLRGLAALQIVSWHLNTYGHAYLAVDFFFMLSGFVLAHSYEDRLRSGEVNAAGFFRRRLIRLYPLIFLGVILGSLAYFFNGIIYGENSISLAALPALIVKGLLLIPDTTDGLREIDGSAMPGFMFPLNPPMWSVFYELVVNVLYGLAIRFLGRRALAAAILGSAAILVYGSLSRPNLNFGFSAVDVMQTLFRTITPFAIGVAIYRLFRAGKLPSLSKRSPVILIILALPLAFMPALNNTGDLVFDLAALFLIFPSVMVVGSQTEVTGNMALLCRWAGDISYPLYILHKPVLKLFELAFAHHTAWIALSGLKGPVILAFIAASAIALKFYDEPLRRWLARISASAS